MGQVITGFLTGVAIAALPIILLFGTFGNTGGVGVGMAVGFLLPFLIGGAVILHIIATIVFASSDQNVAAFSVWLIYLVLFMAKLGVDFNNEIRGELAITDQYYSREILKSAHPIEGIIVDDSCRSECLYSILMSSKLDFVGQKKEKSEYRAESFRVYKLSNNSDCSSRNKGGVYLSSRGYFNICLKSVGIHYIDNFIHIGFGLDFHRPYAPRSSDVAVITEYTKVSGEYSERELARWESGKKLTESSLAGERFELKDVITKLLGRKVETNIQSKSFGTLAETFIHLIELRDKRTIERLPYRVIQDAMWKKSINNEKIVLTDLELGLLFELSKRWPESKFMYRAKNRSKNSFSEATNTKLDKIENCLKFAPPVSVCYFDWSLR